MREIVAFMKCALCPREEEIFCPNHDTDWPYTRWHWMPVNDEIDYCPSCAKKVAPLKQSLEAAHV